METSTSSTPTTPCRRNPGNLTIFCTRGLEKLIFKAFPGLEIDLCLGVVMKIEPEVSGFK